MASQLWLLQLNSSIKIYKKITKAISSNSSFAAERPFFLPAWAQFVSLNTFSLLQGQVCCQPQAAAGPPRLPPAWGRARCHLHIQNTSFQTGSSGPCPCHLLSCHIFLEKYILPIFLFPFQPKHVNKSNPSTFCSYLWHLGTTQDRQRYPALSWMNQNKI